MNIDHRIAIVGVSAIMPGAQDVDAFWQALVEGLDLMTDVPADRWLADDYYDPDPEAVDKTYAKRGAFLPRIEFDPMAFGVPPRLLPATDSAQLLALVVADRLLGGLADAGLGEVDGERVGVFLGCASLQLLGEMAFRTGRPVLRKALRESGVSEPDAEAICERIADHVVPWQEATFPGVLSNVVAGRIANRFDLHGANFTVDAACASSLAALSVAVDDLLLGRSDLVITGGVDTLNDPMTFVCFSKTPALSPTGDCRPFDEHADGTMLGEGIAMFALKRLADAEHDGDRVHAVIRGIGSSSDGSGTSVYAPLDTGQARALRRAYEIAGYGPDTVGLVEAHGTGTSTGDAAEVAALRTVFTETGRADRQWCALGSVKSQIGHTKAAAGAAGLLKATLALRHKVLPPTIKVDQPNPELGLDASPFYLNTIARPWVHTAAHPRRAAVSSFGFGGANFHVTLEEYVGTARPAFRCVARPTELVVLSADTPEALARRCHGFSAGSLASAARTTQAEFRATDNARLAVVASSTGDLTEKLATAAGLIGLHPFSTPTGVHYGVGRQDGRIAFLFPGQGSQYVGMGTDIALHLAVAHDVWNRHGEVADVVFPRPVFTEQARTGQREALTDARRAQPALAIHSLALLAVLDEIGVRPDCVAGHSFGELVALHAARAFDEDTLLRLATRRGELMRDARGVLLALDATADEVADLLAQQQIEEAWLANHNAPQQVVVAAAERAAALVEKCAAADGIGVRRLDTAAAFHSPLVASAAAPLLDFLSGQPVRAPWLDVYDNATAAVYPVEPDQVRHAVADHLRAPVRFADMVGAMHADGARIFVEVGPGGVLTGLVERILAGMPHHAIAMDRARRHGVTSLHDALGRLAALGVPLAFDGLWTSYAPSRPEPPRPAMPFLVDGGNQGRRYPPNEEFVPSAPVPVLTMAATPSSTMDGDVMRALLAAQQETARAHAAYLSMAEKSVDAMMTLSGSSAAPVVPSPPSVPTAAPAPRTVSPALAPEQVAVVAPAPVTAVAGDLDDLESLVLAAVSEKTGYPVEILAPHMELEADLGLDSITRTQVLAALRPLFPQLETVARSQLGQLLTLRTVGEIAERLRHLLASATVAHAPDKTISRHVMRLVRTPAPGTRIPGLGEGTLLVTPDGADVAEAVVRLLGDHGVRAKVGTTASAETGGVLFLGGLSDVASADEAVAIQYDAFHIARTVAPRLREHGGVVVTVQDTGGFGYRDPDPIRSWLGGLAGLARTAGWEWPHASVKAIDCPRGDHAASAIVAELLNGGRERDVVLAEDATRWRLDIAGVPDVAPAASRLRDLGEQPVIVVSGGARGIAAAAVLALAERRRARFVLIGRTEDGPVVQAAVAAVEQTGSQARYLCLDVRDEPALRERLARIREQWGPITGIVHAAGVLADRRVEDKTAAQFDLVFGTKVHGLRALLAATRSDPLRLVCVFSSIVGVTGNDGQGDYAMANDTLNHVIAAEQRLRPDAVVRALLWGPWHGGMVTPELAEVFRLGGVDLIPPSLGAQAFADEVEIPAPDPRVIITAGRALTRMWEVPRG